MMSKSNQNPLVETETHSEIDQLEELATNINNKQCQINNHQADMLALAVEAGALLAKAKMHVKHGEWSAWVAANTCVGRKQASKYMKLSDNEPLLSNVPPTRHLTSIDSAISFILSEKKRLEAPKSGKTKPSPAPAKAPENIPPEEGEECDLKEELAKEGRSMPKGTSTEKSEVIPSVSSKDIPDDEADDESSDDTPLFNKDRTNEENMIEGEFTEEQFTEGNSASTKDIEKTEKKTPTPTIDITNEKDIKTVFRALEPKGKPLTPRQLKIAHNAFKRLLEAGKHG